MKKSLYNLNFEKLCKKLSLGTLRNEPKRIFGGLLHIMYKMQTEKGNYAVKALNPQIMKRENALKNMIFSENVSRIAFDSGINALPAIAINGDSLHEIDDQYYLVFPWFEGKPLAQNCVDIKKCKIIGRLLAKIHNLDFSSITSNIENNPIVKVADWNMYIEKAKALNLIWVSDFLENVDKLYQIEKRANMAVQKSLKNWTISHRDLDQKNVLWNDEGFPMIIDWEAAGPVNQSVELLEVALYWSREESETSNKEAFCAVIDSYTKNGGSVSEDIEDIIYCVFKGKIGWLEYNMKRSVKVECSSDEEQELGTKEVVETIQSIRDYSKLVPVLLKWLYNYITE